MILDAIVEQRKIQLEREQAAVGLAQQKRQAERRSVPAKDFAGALRQDRLSVIAEVKKASPSKGLIAPNFRPVETAVAYRNGGAAAVSVLTEEYYFQGSGRVLQEVRQAVDIPILRKDFIIDPYQIYEARVLDADAVLLIAALLDTHTLREFAKIAHSLSLHCLTEVHDQRELESALEAGSDLVGINNRNLKTFQVDLEVTRRLASSVTKDRVLVSESGIRSWEDMKAVCSWGADAVLIGETLMRSGNPQQTLEQLREGL